VRPKFDAKFADGGFASKEIADLHQEAAQRSVEKGGDGYLEPQGRKEAYKRDPKLVAALAALERPAGGAAVVAADGGTGQALVADARPAKRSPPTKRSRGMGSPLNVFVSTTINLETIFLWYFPRRIVMATVQIVTQIHKQSQNIATCLSNA
jgi:hypothetical protein